MKKISHSLQYVPILSTWKVLLQHEDVLGHIYENPICQGNTMSNYSQGSLFKKNKLLATVPNCSEIILYHDDFGVSNPLRNKFKKYKMPAFYFVLGNIPGKYRSRLKDVQLTLLFPSELTQKYRYRINWTITGWHKNAGINRFICKIWGQMSDF